jgi:M3 family oligoendopeptidase
VVRFPDLAFSRPDAATLAAARTAVEARLEAGDLPGALALWDRQRRDYESWSSLVHLRFAQDTADAAAKAEREYADALEPVATGHATALKQRLLMLPDQAALAAAAGAHPVALWDLDVTTFTPDIAADLETEAKLAAQYSELLASARLSIGGQDVNLAGLAPYAEDRDRAVRQAAERQRWGFFAAQGEALDAIYDALVTLRHGMAQKLGYPNFIPLAYRRLRRVDYGPTEVARYRDEVRQHVVPLVARLLERRRAAHGWDKLRFWDEALIDPAGNPKPIGGHDELCAAAGAMFTRMHPALADFWQRLSGGGFIDLKNRPGKQGGGFCTSFPSIGMPFIFANFTGTHGDIAVFTHEMGHAFQNWESRGLAAIDCLWPSMEAAEIHSMSLEFLTHPHMDLLVGAGAAERFRRMHLEASLAFLPYGVCVDHFQHEIYANPTATPAERHAIWQSLERLYMPWTDYGDLAYPAKGGRWQAKPHIYRSPFYYIDYTLALCCALQFWVRAGRDPAGALADYVALCGRGGSQPFLGLVRSAGLASPFVPGALAEVVAAAERELLG